MIAFSSKQEQVYFAQRALNEMDCGVLELDGIIGPVTRNALQLYQGTHGLAETRELDEATWAYLGDHASIRFLSKEAIISGAHAVGIPPSIAMAIRRVYGRSEGFLPDGRAMLTFERHKFYQYVSQRLGNGTALRWAQRYPNLCSPSWSQTVYRDPQGEWERFDQARMLDATCAMHSSAWGVFQIYGFNYALAGYDDVQDFVSEMGYSEILQYTALLQFIHNQPLFLAAVRQRDHGRIARMFSGRSSVTYPDTERLTAFDQVNEDLNVIS